MIINVYYAFIGAYKLMQHKLIYNDDCSVALFINNSKMHENFENKYSLTEHVDYWFDWEVILKNVMQTYVSPFKCEETVTLEQGLESLRIFLKDRYLVEKDDTQLKIAFEEFRTIIDPEAISAEKFKQSLKPLDLIKKGLIWFFSNFKKYKPYIDAQPKHIDNFEDSEIWKFWLTCTNKVKRHFNIKFQYNKKKMSIKQCFMACYEYVKKDALIDGATSPLCECFWEDQYLLSSTKIDNGSIYYPTSHIACWYDWMYMAQEVVEKYDVDFASSLEKELSLEQGLEAMRIFIDKYYYQKNKEISLVDIFKNMDYQINNNLESSDLWQSWVNSFNEAKKFDKVFYKPYFINHDVP
jgi:hypothetical protein